jgi:hypothetical protein
VKRSLFCLFLTIWTSLELSGQNEVTNFVGKWVEVEGHSKNNDKQPHANWLVTFNESVLTLSELSEPANGSREIKCNLSGRETRYVTSDSIAVKEHAYKCKLSKGKLEVRGVMSVSGFRGNIPPQIKLISKYEVEQTWELSKDGKVLTLREKRFVSADEIPGLVGPGFERDNTLKFQRAQ